MCPTEGGEIAPQWPPIGFVGTGSSTDWVELDQAVTSTGVLGEERPTPVTHGICPACRELVEAKLK